MQAINQLFFGIFSLILISLFIGTYRSDRTGNYRYVQNFWVASVGLRAIAFAIWGLVPITTPFLSSVGNTFFIGSAACLALLFRSWRKPVDIQIIKVVGIFVCMFFIAFELIRQESNSFIYRMNLVSTTSLLMTCWELFELRKKIQVEQKYLLKIIFFVTIIQALFTITSLLASNYYSPTSISDVTQNSAISMFFIWITLSFHLIIYMFIGSYMFESVIKNEQKMTLEKQEAENLLAERESMISALLLANRATSTGALSASLAHELSQPLAASMINVGILQRKFTQLEQVKAEDREILEAIIRDNRRASNIVLSLKKIFKQENIELEAMRILEAFERLKPIIYPQLRTKHVELISDIAFNPIIKLNVNEFHQVIVNIANNAIEAMEQANIAVKKIFLRTEQADDKLLIVISDNGPGISNEKYKDLFELLKTTKESGMGLGLWLSRHIIEQRHGGTIDFNLLSQSGAELRITLPIVKI
jgi:signal transduction histidine kinase